GEPAAPRTSLEQHSGPELDDSRLALEGPCGVEQPRERPVHTTHGDSLRGPAGLRSSHPNTTSCTPNGTKCTPIGVLQLRPMSAKLSLDRILASQPGARSHVTGRRATSLFFWTRNRSGPPVGTCGGAAPGLRCGRRGP